MSSEERLAEVFSALEEVGLKALVMGGHAVRYYGFSRDTVDFDLRLSPESWDDLSSRLQASRLGRDRPVVEGPSWRHGSFRRFQIGTLPTGKEEWLEFWKGNHLLEAYDIVESRKEVGEYGGRKIPFMGLVDLIRSTETERIDDWLDISRLEEILDARNYSRFRSGIISLAEGLSNLRSRTGLESYHQLPGLDDKEAVAQAIQLARNPITIGYLLPFAPMTENLSVHPAPEPVVIAKLRSCKPVSPIHWGLAELIRRQYRDWCKKIDKADKESIRAEARGE